MRHYRPFFFFFYLCAATKPVSTTPIWDFPGSSVDMTSPSSEGGEGSTSLVGEQDPTCLQVKEPKHKIEAIL